VELCQQIEYSEEINTDLVIVMVWVVMQQLLIQPVLLL